MFTPRQTVVQPVGLVTQPSQYGQYPPGALRVAKNLLLRRPGELVQAPDASERVQPPYLAAASALIHKLMPLDSGHVYSWALDGIGWEVFENSSAVTLPTSLAALGFAQWVTTRITPFRLAGRMLANSRGGVLVGDSMAPTTPTLRALRYAGMPQPIMTDLQLIGGGVIPPATMIGYRGVWRRNFDNAYSVVSVPSPTFKAYLTAGPNFNTQFTVRQPIAPLATDSIQVGDVFELYRTNGLATGTITADPGDTFNLVASQAWTAADAAAGFMTVIDAQSFLPFGSTTTPGRALYTNPGQEGEALANDQPPIAQCMATFDGFAFYANTTDRPQWEWSVQGGVAVQSIAIAAGAPSAYFKRYGIGQREGAGTITGGSAVITAVSAADMVGIQVGQRWAGIGGQWTTANKVSAIGATTITMDAPAAGVGAAWTLNDVIEIDGVEVVVPDFKTFVAGSSALRKYEIESSVAVGISEYTVGAEVTVRPLRFNGGPSATMTVRATNGANYFPVVPALTATAKVLSSTTLENHYVFSKEQQGEHAPASQEGFAGSGSIIALVNTRDALWFWCTDGLYRLSGKGGAWRLDQVNSTLILAGPGASDALDETLYGYTNAGFVGVDSAGTLDPISDKVIGDLLPGARFESINNIVVCRNESEHEVLLLIEDAGPTLSRTVFVYNASQRGWTTLESEGESDLGSVSTLAYQRQPASGAGRTLFGSRFLDGLPGYSAWIDTAGAFLEAALQYQPMYAVDPLTFKQWVWADYLFSANDNGRTFKPVFNDVAFASAIAVQLLDEGCYARAFVPRANALAHSISPGFAELGDTGVQARFQGISLAVKEFGNQSKKR